MVWPSSKGSGLKTLHRIYAALAVVETLRQCWVSQFGRSTVYCVGVMLATFLPLLSA
jgi:hypothetical protein